MNSYITRHDRLYLVTKDFRICYTLLAYFSDCVISFFIFLWSGSLYINSFQKSRFMLQTCDSYVL